MKPYQTIRLIEYPDIYDIKIEGRNSRTGGPHCPSLKHRIRRTLKRIDRQRSLREELRVEREAELQETQELNSWSDYEYGCDQDQEQENVDYWDDQRYGLYDDLYESWEYEPWE